MLNDKVILITGGTGSFGNKFVERIFTLYKPKKVIIYSRDEYKQFVMRQKYLKHDKYLRYFIGDVRDRDRLSRAFEGVDYVVHAAALKQIPACEYNPFEAIKTNIHGAQNIVDAAIDKGIKKVVALSTDKAVNPINLYGATKLASDKLFIAANAYTGSENAIFSVVRYGNVSGSRGSVIPFFKMLLDKGEKELPITDFRMTRFWITLDEAVDLVFKALDESKGGETYISKIPSFKITDLAQAMFDNVKLKEVGIREGEKLHEVMITEYDSFTAYEYPKHFIIYPNFEWWNFDSHFTSGGNKVDEFFNYASDNNTEWLSVDDLKKRLKQVEIIY
ncbi:UDP-N-acetylglucosamine 4,6-dehydratase (inverting) [Spirochaetota bacterium]